MPDNPPIIVIAGTHQEFCEWLHENRIPRERARFCSCKNEIMALANRDVYLVGRYWMLRDFAEMKERLEMAKLMGIRIHYKWEGECPKSNASS
jgi:hypothetical protein